MTADPRDLRGLLELEPHGPDVFVGDSPQYPWGRVYGGQVAAQGLRAAAATVNTDHRVHSLHAYFIRGGDSSEPIRYEVDRIRNGRSFVTRRVVARQSSGAILNLDASFQTVEDQADVQAVDLPDDLDGRDTVANDTWGPLMDRRTVLRNQGQGRAAVWMRVLDDLGEDPVLQACGLTYLSDDVPMEAAVDLHPRNTKSWEEHDEAFLSASLDHCLWFHRPVRADAWLLFDLRSHGLAGGRGLSFGEVFDESGTHVASVSQEVLLRTRG